VDPLRGPEEVLAEIAELDPGPDATVRLQQLYAQPVREELIGRRVEELKAAGSPRAASPRRRSSATTTSRSRPGSTCSSSTGSRSPPSTSASRVTDPLDLRSFTARYDIPVIVGGVASAKSALHLMRTGAVGVLVGVGASSVSTTRAALGVHVPLATAIAEVAAARARYLEESGRYVHVIAAGGIRTGGHLATAIACGADAVMLGRPLGRRRRGARPRGVLGAVGRPPRAASGSLRPGRALGPLEVILRGPAHRDDGSVNLIGGLRRAMGVTGYETLAGCATPSWRSVRGSD
jgi:IMP dehydrogenase